MNSIDLTLARDAKLRQEANEPLDPVPRVSLSVKVSPVEVVLPQPDSTVIARSRSNAAARRFIGNPP